MCFASYLALPYSHRVTNQDPAQVPWGDLAWIERTPLGEPFMVAMAPRGFMLYSQPVSGDLAEVFVKLIAQGVVALAFRKDETWKVGVFRAKAMQVRRCVFKRTGLTQEEAEQAVERLRECVRSGDLSWA